MLVSMVTRASLVVIWQQASIIHGLGIGHRVRVQSFRGLAFRGQSFLALGLRVQSLACRV